MARLNSHVKKAIDDYHHQRSEIALFKWQSTETTAAISLLTSLMDGDESKLHECVVWLLGHSDKKHLKYGKCLGAKSRLRGFLSAEVNSWSSSQRREQQVFTTLPRSRPLEYSPEVREPLRSRPIFIDRRSSSSSPPRRSVVSNSLSNDYYIDSGDESLPRTKVEKEQPSKRSLASLNFTNRKAFENLQIYAHITKEENLRSIGETGLIPGKTKGIGFPETSEQDLLNVYVLSGSLRETTTFVGTEAGCGFVGIISAVGATSRDINYKKGAHYFATDGIPSIEVYENGKSVYYAFTFPLTETARINLASFINERAEKDGLVSPDEAEALVVEVLKRNFVIYMIPFYK